MRRALLESAFQSIQVKPGQPLTPLHRQLLRVLERREKYKQERRNNKGR